MIGRIKRSSGPLLSSWLSLPPNLRGATYVLLSSFLFSCMSLLVKILGQTVPPPQIAFFRCAVGLAVLMPLVVRAGPEILKTSAMPIHIGRGIAGMTAISCGAYAFTHLPLATATAASFTKPLFILVLAALLLGEVVRWRRWTAAMIGFAGVLVMVRPFDDNFDPVILVALVQALAIAVAVILVKKLPKEERNLTILFYVSISAAVASSIPAAFVWVPMTLEEWGLAISIGVVGLASQSIVLMGFRVGEAAAVAPVDYTRLLFATGFGIVLFAEWPDPWTIGGAGIIIASTLYIARREARAASDTVPVGA